MKKAILLGALLFGSIMLRAQYQSDFEEVKSANGAEVIYKGSCTFDDVEKVPAFKLIEQSENYKPDESTIESLSEELNKYQLIIFLGTWCEDSHRLVPQLYRVLTDVGYPFEQLQILALDRDKKGRNGEEKQYKITNVPTIIVMQDGNEKGRITESVKQNVERDLLEIINKTN
jgi:thiol-disulfide isomerase/thioredoxin